MHPDYRITVDDGRQLADAEIVEQARLFSVYESEVWPEDPPMPDEQALAAHRSLPARLRQTAIRAWAEDTTLAGTVNLHVDPEHDDDPDIYYCFIVVAPSHRRRGVASRLLAEVVKIARETGRSRLLAWIYAAVPAGDEFAAAIGGGAKFAGHLNHLPTAEVDRALMEKWVQEGPIRAPDYELIAWDGPAPDEYVEDFVDLALVMNDAPRDDLSINDETLTPALYRERQERSAALGHKSWTIVARRVSDGEMAGFHEMLWLPHAPKVMHVEATGVRRDHRGHALGKWLKAAMTLRILDERPGVTDIRTENADSNDAMLGINKEMGYRPMAAAMGWEVQIDDAARWLDGRRADQ